MITLILTILALVSMYGGAAGSPPFMHENARAGARDIVWLYDSPLTVYEEVTDLGDGLYQYSYSFENVDDKNLWHFGVFIGRAVLVGEERVVLEIPLTIGAPAAALGILAAPVLAALAAFAALITECTIEVEKIDFDKECPDHKVD